MSGICRMLLPDGQTCSLPRMHHGPHNPVNRQRLVARARELGVYDAPEERTDQELADAIAAEESAGEWLDRLEALPTDEEKRAAVARLAEEFRRQS